MVERPGSGVNLCYEGELMFKEHPDYVARRQELESYRDLYLGGEAFKRNGGKYLLRRQREPQTVYAERLERLFYENYAGSIVDWYAATLFRREPQIVLDGGSQRSRGYFLSLLGDCDRNGTDLSEFFRQQMTNAMIYGASYTLIDFPRINDRPKTLAEEQESGANAGYLQAFTPLDVIDWSHDDAGRLEWVVLRTQRLRRARVTDPEWKREIRWTYFDRTCFQVYRQVEGSNAEPELLDEGYHGLASLQQVPLIETKVSDGLWMMRKAAPLQIEHFNKSNALSWALTMGLFAMPVVYSDREFKQMLGESYYIQLGPEDRFGWTEPEGHVYQLAANNLDRLKQEIYRICYLTHQGGPVAGEGPSQSGLSKQRDYAITQEVLQALGDRAKESLKLVLRALSAARQDGVAIDVAGLDEFDLGEFEQELNDGERLLAMGISSPTLREQVQKRLALKYLSDLRPEVKDRISREIELGVQGGRDR